jgi:hypothetical protein
MTTAEQPIARRRAPVRAKITSNSYGSRSFSSPVANDPGFPNPKEATVQRCHYGNHAELKNRVG